MNIGNIDNVGKYNILKSAITAEFMAELKIGEEKIDEWAGHKGYSIENPELLASFINAQMSILTRDTFRFLVELHDEKS